MIIRFIKDLLLHTAQVPANLVARASMAHPAVAAKFIPFSSRQLCYVLPKKTSPPTVGPDGLPVPPKERWEGYGPTAKEYLEIGKENVTRLREVLKEGGYQFNDGDRILEFGCASGRMLRWFQDEARRGEVWGADINAPHILWAQQFLSPPFHFVITTTFPHLPFPDGYFNLIYAGSVFSHIADLADAWLLELGRIMAPGGKLFVSICDAHTLDELLTKHRDTAWADIMRPYARKIESERINYEMFTVRRSPQGAQVFYDADFFVRKLDPVFRLISVTQDAYGIQTGVLAEKKPTAR